MPIFSVDGGRPVVAHPVRPADVAYGATVVDEHLGALLGEHLLPVQVRSGAEDEPYLLAVDAQGRPVVVDVVGVLDGASLLRALTHLGRAARLSLRDLAARYRGGAPRFAADLATFRESIPVARLGEQRRSARLLLVCAQVGDGVADAVEALADRDVDVLQVGLVDGPDGRLVDVSPVRLAAPDGSWRVAGGVATLTPQLRHGIGEPPDEDTVSQVPRLVTRVPTGILPSQSPRLEATPARGTPQWSPVAAPPAVVPVAASLGEGAPPPADPAAANPSLVADPRLLALAADGPVVLVWHRRRRGQWLEAMVRPDGLVELADGTRVADPSAAAEIASASQVPVDGWRVWRVGTEDGPELGAVCGA